jgi:hypothetical protein
MRSINVNKLDLVKYDNTLPLATIDCLLEWNINTNEETFEVEIACNGIFFSCIEITDNIKGIVPYIGIGFHPPNTKNATMAV